MSSSANKVLLWSPRILGILVALFMGTFAFDAVGEGIVALLLHLLPSLLLLLVVAMSWRWEWVGGVVFIGLAALYTLTTLHRLDWILTIAGPLLVVGVLYLWSWRSRARSAKSFEVPLVVARRLRSREAPVVWWLSETQPC